MRAAAVTDHAEQTLLFFVQTHPKPDPACQLPQSALQGLAPGTHVGLLAWCLRVRHRPRKLNDVVDDA